MPAMFQRRRIDAGMSALRLAGFELKIMRPTCWMYQSPVFVT